jgi:serine/threonine-protein kinase
MAVEVGQLFGNYRMVRLLGEGGFGEVYLVENPLIHRRAAVKVLHTELARDAVLENTDSSSPLARLHHQPSRSRNQGRTCGLSTAASWST